MRDDSGAPIAAITELLEAASARAGAAEDALVRSRAHARQVEQSLGRKGLRKLAYRMGEVVAGLGRVGQALVSERATLTEYAGQVAAVPAEAVAGQVIAALEPVAKQLADVPARVQAASAKVDGLQAEVAATLRGATPGPLLAKLEQIKTPLTDVAASVSAAAQRTAELIAAARAAGGAGQGRPAAVAATEVTAATRQPRVRWADPEARQRWYDDWTANPDNWQASRSGVPWAGYQEEQVGEMEYKLVTDDGDEIWADGLVLEPDTVVAVEVKYVSRPKRSMYEGTVPPGIRDKLLRDFDDEMTRYGNVVRSEGNPVGD